MVKCTCGIVHEESELLKFLPNDDIYPDEKIECHVCPICNDIEIDPDEEYPENYDEEKSMDLRDEKDFLENNNY